MEGLGFRIYGRNVTAASVLVRLSEKDDDLIHCRPRAWNVIGLASDSLDVDGESKSELRFTGAKSFAPCHNLNSKVPCPGF